MAVIENPCNWTTETMEYILQEGDKLHSNIDVGNQLLLPSDLPTCVHMNGRVCEIVKGKEAFGSFVEKYSRSKENLICFVYIHPENSNISIIMCG